tara:strand:- start:3390 stop:3749 length:360 start_codon:yes stop_codon:yes gene_type:complete
VSNVTISVHHKDETILEGKPIAIALFVTGDLTPPRAGKLHGPPENCYPAEGGTFDIIEVKPMWYCLAGEDQYENMERYRDLTGFKGAWEELVDKDYCTELAIEEYQDQIEREMCAYYGW